MDPKSSHEIFAHKCKTPGCPVTVQFDDEPWCYTHSPTEGSSVPGYSARAEAEAANEIVNVDSEQVTNTETAEPPRHNIFDKGN